MKAFADDKLELVETVEFVLDREENIVHGEKGKKCSCIKDIGKLPGPFLWIGSFLKKHYAYYFCGNFGQ